MKSSLSYNHYVYRITNIVENKHYYGKRSCKVQPCHDLGIKYFSSSADKEFISDQKENPENYKYKIIRQFNSSKSAIQFEILLHHKFQVGSNPSFYNRAMQTSTKFNMAGIAKSAEHRRKIKESCKGRVVTEETRRRQSEAHKGKKHKPHTEEARKKISESHKSRTYKPHTEEAKRKISAASRGRKCKPLTDEHRQKLREAAKGRKPSAETLAKMSEAQKGRQHTEESRQKMSASHKGKIYIHNPETGVTRVIKNTETIPDGWVRGKVKKVKGSDAKPK